MNRLFTNTISRNFEGMFWALLLTLGLAHGLHAQNLVTSVEAENGTLVGLSIANQTGNSSGKYVTGFDATGDKVTVTVNVAKSAIYRLRVAYRANQGPKTQDLYVNGTSNGSLSFPSSTNFVELDAGGIWLISGNNTITIQSNWGYMDVDKFSIYTSVPHVYNIDANLVDPSANQVVKDLYTFFKCQFGKKIISGQTDSYYDNLKTTAGKSPMLRAFDFQTYTAGYSYKWVNNGHAFGADPNGSTEAAIAWYNGTGKKGIVSFQWHWHSPSGGTAGTNTFYTDYTTFDVTQAVISGTQQNKDVIRDIDAIAVELKKLRDANVPVVWRPLHEAGGAWFWWGAKGPAACKSLYNILFDRIVNYHGIHNLIWAWSTPEADWYPGNTKVDLIGYDSYPGANNYTVQKATFDQLFTIVNGQKLIAMTENGPIPDIQLCFDMDAPWAYFMSWSDLVTAQNTTQHIKDVFANASVLTVENPGSTCVVTNVDDTAKEQDGTCFPNPFTESLRVRADGDFVYTVYDMMGHVMESGTGHNTLELGQNLVSGMYLLKVNTQTTEENVKVIKD